uniref:Transmembrane protein n=1 Tax=Heterorhabditis bacteriophora TaxID=37862 RepID=A0A1I7XI64_HETBA
MSSSVSDISIIGRDSSHPRSRNTSKGSVSISQRSSISSSTSTSFSSSSENFTVDPRMIPEWNPDDLSEMVSMFIISKISNIILVTMSYIVLCFTQLPSGLLPVPKLEDVNIGGAALVSEIKRLRKELDMERDVKQKTIKDYANLQVCLKLILCICLIYHICFKETSLKNCLLGQTALFSIVEEELNDLKKKIIPNEDSEMHIEDYVTEYRKLIKSRNEERLEKENAEFELQLEISKSFTIDCDDLICRLKSDGRCSMEEKIKRKGLVQSLEKQVSDLEESLYQARKEFKKENKLRIALQRELKYLSIFSFDFFDNSVLADCQLCFTCCDQVFFCKDVFNGLIIDDYHSMAEMTRTVSEYAVEKVTTGVDGFLYRH